MKITLPYLFLASLLAVGLYACTPSGGSSITTSLPEGEVVLAAETAPTGESRRLALTPAAIIAVEAEALDSLRAPLRPLLGPEADELFQAIDGARTRLIQEAISTYLQTTSIRSRPPGLAQQGISAAGLVSFTPVLLDQIGHSPDVAKVPLESEDTGGEIKTKMKITSSLEGDTLRIQGDLSVSVSKGGETLDETSQIILILQVCPDSDGRVPLDITLTMSSTVSSDTTTYTEQLKGSGHGTAHVSDDAELVSYSTDVNMERSSQYIDKTDASKDEYQYAEAFTHGEVTAGEPYATAQTRVTRSSSQAQQGIIDAAVKASQELLDGLIAKAFEAAADLWQHGYCVEIVLEGAGDSNDVEVGSTTNFTTKVRHKFEGVELNVPLEATFSGQESLEPNGKGEAPIDYTYHASMEENTTGSIDYETRSKRGVANKTVTFITGSTNYHPVAPPYTWSGVACSFEQPFSLSHTGLMEGSYSFTPSGATSGAVTMSQTAQGCKLTASGTYIIEHHGGGNPNADMIMDVHGTMACPGGVSSPFDTELRILFEPIKDPSC